MSGPVLLCVLDGFGIGDGGDADATALAHTPFLEHTRATCPHAQLETSGEAVGLPPGQMGNSEVGHMTMGSGRVIVQDMTRISGAFDEGAMETNPEIVRLLEAVTHSGGVLHLMGLVSDGGVHSHQNHLYKVLSACAERGVATAVHVFLDGRDTPPRSGLDYVRALQAHVQAAGSQIATLSGRYWAMDRDSRWDRIQRAYEAIVLRRGRQEPDAETAVESAYTRDQSDEFVEPCVIAGGRALEDGDGVFFLNFRADRARQLTNALTGACPERFGDDLVRERTVRLSGFLCLTRYSADFGLPEAFAPLELKNVLGAVLSKAGRPQLRMAETEKYAHVTFFFNAGAEEPFDGEDRVLIPSPRDVATYDLKPEMSAKPLAEALVSKLDEGSYTFILMNFANPDMVGHTGILDAAVKAVETIDTCLERVTRAVLDLEGQVLITADHGNCELMVDPVTGQPHTAHTTGPVPLYWIRGEAGAANVKSGLRNGGLADLAPTVLELIGLPQPAEMSGRSLLR